MSETPGTLRPGEAHPSARKALDYVRGLGFEKLMRYLASFSSCAIEGNRLGEVCSETLRRVIESEPVSDRYLLGLAWTLRSMEDEEPADDWLGATAGSRLSATPETDVTYEDDPRAKCESLERERNEEREKVRRATEYLIHLVESNDLIDAAHEEVRLFVRGLLDSENAEP